MDATPTQRCACYGQVSVLVALLACLPAGNPAEVAAQPAPFWQPAGGPPGAGVRALVIDEQRGYLFAGLRNGVFRSPDNGDSWEQTTLAAIPIHALTLGPDGTLWAGTERAGLYRSSDDGLTWAPSGLDTLTVTALAAGTGGLFAGTAQAGLWRSTDEGQSWTSANEGLDGLNIGTLMVGDTGDLFVGLGGACFGCGGGDLFKSTDAGATWSRLWTTSVGALLETDGGLLAGTLGGSVWRTTDGGTTWEAAFTGIDNPYVLALAADADGQVFAGTHLAGSFVGGFYRTQDGGTTWEHVGRDATTATVQALTIDSAGTIFAGTRGGGAFRSTDGGATWQAINEGLTYSTVTALATSATGAVFVAAYGAGVFLQQQDEEAWAPLNDGLAHVGVSALAVGAEGHLHAGLDFFGAYRSTDAGTTWTPAAFNNLSVYVLAVDPRGTLWAGTDLNDFGSPGLWSSADGGATYTPALPASVYAVAFSDQGPYYARSLDHLYRSADGGTTWDNLGALPVPSVFASNASLAYHPAGIVLAGTPEGIYRRFEGADTTWAALGLAEHAVADLLTTPDGIIYAATSAGVFHSSDSGTTWGQAQEGLPASGVLVLALDADGHLLAGTDGYGVYRSIAPVYVGREDPGGQLSDRPSLLPNYPNPFEHTTTLAFRIPSATRVRLALYDLLGRRVAVLADGPMAAGTHRLPFDAGSLPAGLYVYRLETPGFTRTRAMVLTR